MGMIESDATTAAVRGEGQVASVNKKIQDPTKWFLSTSASKSLGEWRQNKKFNIGIVVKGTSVKYIHVKYASTLRILLFFRHDGMVTQLYSTCEKSSNLMTHAHEIRL
jgi:hypothetical protein